VKQAEAEKLLGGYATGTLTEEERRDLLAAALDHQAIFEALVDEEALRELLADPEAKAQLLAALLAQSAPLKVVPLWRRTGVLGAAASLIVAATAGLAYLRSPDALPTIAKPETVTEPAVKAVEAPTAAQASAPRQNVVPAPSPRGSNLSNRDAMAQAAPPPADHLPAVPAVGGSVSVQEEPTRMKERLDFLRAEAPPPLAKKAEAPRAAAAAAAVVEVISSRQDAASKRKAGVQDRSASGVPGGVPGGVIGGVVGGVVGGAAATTAGAAKGGHVSIEPGAPALPGARQIMSFAELAPTAVPSPTWNMEVRPDGSTQVEVTCAKEAVAVLLQRGPSGAKALAVHSQKLVGEALIQLRWILRLSAKDALDLYLLNHPVADASRLPETGPVEGFRARIHPAEKKVSPR
jgi:hypothetical protein